MTDEPKESAATGGAQTDEPFAAVTTHPRFERGWNGLQATMEIVVTLAVLAGLLGLFGGGPLSSAIARGADGATTISYQRIMRRTVQNEMTIKLEHPVTGRTVEVLMPHAFLEGMTIASSSPRARAMRLEPNGIAYEFDVGPAGLGQITFDLKARLAGWATSPFLVAGEPIVLHQFVFP